HSRPVRVPGQGRHGPRCSPAGPGQRRDQVRRRPPAPLRRDRRHRPAHHRFQPRRRRRGRDHDPWTGSGARMIVTFTPNPSLDRAITIPDLRRGEVIRATSSRVDPGGKGVNVARALAAQGSDTIAVLPSGGAEGRMMEELLREAGVTAVTTPVEGSLRMNISVLEPDGTTTKLNEPGPELDEETVAHLLATTFDASSPGSWVVGCGSLP